MIPNLKNSAWANLASKVKKLGTHKELKKQKGADYAAQNKIEMDEDFKEHPLYYEYNPKNKIQTEAADQAENSNLVMVFANLILFIAFISSVMDHQVKFLNLCKI